MKKKRAIIAVLLFCSLLLTAVSLHIGGRRRVVPMTVAEIQFYERYELDSSFAKDDGFAANILAAWEENPSALAGALYDCAGIIDAGPWGDGALLEYVTPDSLRVSMIYGRGLENKTVYDERADMAFVMSGTENMKHIHFRHGWEGFFDFLKR